WAIVFAIAPLGCLRQTQFQCANDPACGADGRCESTGFCSFPDTGCAGGRRYGDSAGNLAGKCVGAVTRDGGIEAPRGDGPMGDTPAAGCPAGYAPLPNIPTHVYKLVNVNDHWDNHQAACRLTSASAHLAIPDDATELAALDTLAGGI